MLHMVCLRQKRLPPAEWLVRFLTCSSTQRELFGTAPSISQGGRSERRCLPSWWSTYKAGIWAHYGLRARGPVGANLQGCTEYMGPLGWGHLVKGSPFHPSGPMLLFRLLEYSVCSEMALGRDAPGFLEQFTFTRLGRHL